MFFALKHLKSTNFLMSSVLFLVNGVDEIEKSCIRERIFKQVRAMQKYRILTHKYACIGCREMLIGSSLLRVIERTKFQASWL
jgi:hypothetical protein